MKTYNDLMEVMAMADMNKIKGGTEEQRRIAQERQRRRENKSGVKPNNTSSAITKTTPKALPPADKGASLVKQKQQKAAPIQKAPKPPVEKVKVKVEPPKKQPVKDERQAPGRRRVPDQTYPPLNQEKKPQKPKKKKPNKFLKGVSGELKNRFGRENLGRKATSAVLDAPGKLGRAALSQHKNQKTTGTSSAGDLDGGEVRMYGDERF